MGDWEKKNAGSWGETNGVCHEQCKDFYEIEFMFKPVAYVQLRPTIFLLKVGGGLPFKATGVYVRLNMIR